MNWNCKQCSVRQTHLYPGGLCAECVPEPHAHHCTVCGAREPNRWVPETKERLARLSLCFNCDLWRGIISRADRFIRIAGVCYVDNGKNKPRDGFGGRTFRIRMNDGREITTDNLWTQGVIPERFRAEFPDNAMFATEGVGFDENARAWTSDTEVPHAR